MISRLFSFLMAASLSLTLLFAAPVFASNIQGSGRGILMLGLLGIAGGFVHGVGFTPHHLLFKILFNPWVSRFSMASIFLLYS